jgi:hypothetical protein
VIEDPLEEMPPESRTELVAAVRAELEVDGETAEDLIRSAEPLWNAMERAGGMVDSWGGGEFCAVFPGLLSFIRSAAQGE